MAAECSNQLKLGMLLLTSSQGEITGNSTDEAYVSNAAAVKRYTGIATSSQQQGQPRSGW